jgi:Dyp-type peroxidase family
MHPNQAQLQPVRETPAPPPSVDDAPDPTWPNVSNEDVLRVDNIQGNIIAGFNKDQQTLIFLRFRRDGDTAKHVNDFRQWLAIFTPFIATADEVLQFNRLFKRIRTRRKRETSAVQATWINIAFSFAALKLLNKEAEKFTDAAFRQGMAARAVSELNDPADENHEGNPKNWVLGGTDNEADVVIIVASDDPNDLAATVSRIEQSIYGGRTFDGLPLNSGVHICYKQEGATLPPPLTGHEHFGWLDGVSQPGLRGRISDKENDVLTLRQNPTDPNQGKPGQDLLWPGEFVFGYAGQDPTAKDITVKGPDSLKHGPDGKQAGPDWAKDGSYLVIRRLRQDVAGFHAFLEAMAKQTNSDAHTIGAKLVGRWKSGAPIMRNPEHDDPLHGADDCTNNNFEFASEAESDEKPAAKVPWEGQCPVSEEAKPDETGAVCSFASHIRKAYPRNDEGTLDESIGEVTTQTHRLLRRGIPFGAPFFAPTSPGQKDSGNRGLVFAAYQTSFVEQFEFVMQSWVNNPEFKDKSKDGKVISGHDLIIGQSNGSGGDRTRSCPIRVAGKEHEIIAPTDWVIPTGGGYFFAPSISALELLAGRSA